MWAAKAAWRRSKPVLKPCPDVDESQGQEGGDPFQKNPFQSGTNDISGGAKARLGRKHVPWVHLYTSWIYICPRRKQVGWVRVRVGSRAWAHLDPEICQDSALHETTPETLETSLPISPHPPPGRQRDCTVQSWLPLVRIVPQSDHYSPSSDPKSRPGFGIRGSRSVITSPAYTMCHLGTKAPQITFIWRRIDYFPNVTLCLSGVRNKSKVT